jgi:hypothetical protein
MSAQPTLKIGSQGASVTFLQKRLNANGYKVAEDGDFGPGTEQAVEQFQAANNMKADGIVGPMTWTLLLSKGSVAVPKDVVAEQKAALTALIPATTPAHIKAVLTTAIGKLGAKEVPAGSNGGPELADIVGGDGKVPSAYYVHWGIKDANILKSMPPWCAIFVSWALKIGLGKTAWKDIPFGNWFGGASQIEDWGKKHGKLDGGHHVPSGALFTVSRDKSGSDAASSAGAGHVGFIVCDHGDGTVTTVEGNVSNKVASHRRKKSDLRCFILWW